MPIKAEDVQWVEEPEIGFWEATFLPAIVQGLRTTIGHIVRQESVTQEYPEVKPQLPLNYRGVHRLNRDDQRVKCVAASCAPHAVRALYRHLAAPSPLG
jgi:NADH-quinone oxidoreductase subunit I